MHHPSPISQALWSQFGASLEMLENAIGMCPDEHWDTKIAFGYAAYHCLFWTDYFLTTNPATFQPPAPFSLSEFGLPGQKPDRVYTRAEVTTYLYHCRNKARQLIGSLTNETLNDRWINDYKNYSLLEILLYNNRHIQHHAAQLNLLLRQTINDAPAWVSQAQETVD